jgi:hypothetical protein
MNSRTQTAKPWTFYDYFVTAVLGSIFFVIVGYFLWEMWG